MAPDAAPAPLRVLQLVADVLDRLGVPYLAAGSLASSLHGEPRATDDVDLVADLAAEHAEPIVAALRPAFYVDGDAVREAIARGASFNAIHLATAVKVDLFVAGSDLLDRERLRRRVRVRLPDMPDGIWMDVAEGIVLRKLEWYRRGGEIAERQWRDVLGVLKVQGERLDRDFLLYWAEAFGLRELLARALAEAGLRHS